MPTAKLSPDAALIRALLGQGADVIPFKDRSDLEPRAAEIIGVLANDTCGLDLLRLCSFGGHENRQAMLCAALMKKRYPVRIKRFEEACLALTPAEWGFVRFTPADVFAALSEFRLTTTDGLLAWHKLSPRPLPTDRYWLKAAEAAIALPDWPAAWEAVRYALLGVPLTPNLEAEQLAEWSPWKTTDRLQDGRALFSDLIAATAVLDRVFMALPSNDRKLLVRDDDVEIRRDGLRRDDRWVPGILELTPFAVRAKPGHEWPLKLKPSGQRVLAIARTVADIMAVRAASAPSRPRSRKAIATVAS